MHPRFEPTGDRSANELLALLAVLADRTRRRLIVFLAYGNPEDVDDIPEDIRATDYVEGEALEGFLESLREEHLPALEDSGIIDWDRETDVVTRGERFEDLWPILRLMIAHRERLPTDWLAFADLDELERAAESADRSSEE